VNATEVREYFERVAGDWDQMRLAWYDERVIDELAAHTHLTGSSVVLDVGTGTGFVAAGLAPLVDAVIAIDHAPAILEVARANLAQLAITNIELREADIASIPLDDDTVDAAVANMVLHHAEDPAATLTEMTRVTKPGGWVAVTDEVEHTHEWMRTEHADIWLGFSADQIAGFFGAARLEHYGYTPLGMQ
jgi:ubiquinone/menaquinone biosynthesis C-methylase UbiE